MRARVKRISLGVYDCQLKPHIRNSPIADYPLLILIHRGQHCFNSSCQLLA